MVIADVQRQQPDMSIKVQVLYSEGCGYAASTAARVRSVAEEMELDMDLEMVLVENEEQARALHFLGSPTVRVHGRDIDPHASSNGIGGLS